MSLSTFKRHFIVEYNEAPGKWLQDKRLQRAKEILKEGQLKLQIFIKTWATTIFLLSIAFKINSEKSKRNSLKQNKRNNLKQISCDLWHTRIIVNR
jgi:AraC-like DNA-binding protein